MSLSSKLAELTAFDIKDAAKHGEYMAMKYGQKLSGIDLTLIQTNSFEDGALWQHARLAPYLILLCECADALERIEESGSLHFKTKILAKLQSLVDKAGG